MIWFLVRNQSNILFSWFLGDFKEVWSLKLKSTFFGGEQYYPPFGVKPSLFLCQNHEHRHRHHHHHHYQPGTSFKSSNQRDCSVRLRATSTLTERLKTWLITLLVGPSTMMMMMINQWRWWWGPQWWRLWPVATMMSSAHLVLSITWILTCLVELDLWVWVGLDHMWTGLQPKHEVLQIVLLPFEKVWEYKNIILSVWFELDLWG